MRSIPRVTRKEAVKSEIIFEFLCGKNKISNFFQNRGDKAMFGVHFEKFRENDW